MSGQAGPTMRYVDEFRDPVLVNALLARIEHLMPQLPDRQGMPLQIMEVCGGHTHAIFKFGLDQLLPDGLEFVHGPGCPVCVLPMGRIDSCLEIAAHPEVKRLGLTNFSLFCQHITIIPTLRSLLQQPDVCIDGFLAPGHVSMVIGTTPYAFICGRFDKPLVVTGFEPLDILQGLVMLLEQKVSGRCEVENQYRRIVPDSGNMLAQQALAEVFTAKVSSEWRGLGEIADSGVELSPAYQAFDAELRFKPQQQRVADDPRSRCGDVLTGRCEPDQCPLFGRDCTPENAFGALMVSSEGACSAYYLYR